MNVTKLIASTLLPAALALPGAAMAAQGSLTVSGVTVKLIDLDTTDGVTPSISFSNEEGGGGSHVEHLPWPESIDIYRNSLGTATNASQWAIAEATIGSKSLNLSAETLQESVKINVSANTRSSFTLSKNTLAVFSLPYTVSLTKSSGEYLYSSLHFSAFVPDSYFSSDYTFNKGPVTSTLFGEVYTTDTALNGHFNMWAQITANSSGAPPVPEPGTYAMLLAGLGVIGWRLRQRNSAAA